MSTTTTTKNLPAIRACLFDMDGLLLDTEDIYSRCTNEILAKYNKPPLPWSIKAKLQGRPGPAANALFREWAGLPISAEEYHRQYYGLQALYFPAAKPLPGVEALLAGLKRAGVYMALATSAHEANFKLKTGHLGPLFSLIPKEQQVLGDDPRIPKGRGKPLPDIYLVALKTINDRLPKGVPQIKPEECLVFEDSVPGVEAGRRAGMRVAWVPHKGLRAEYKGREDVVLAGRTGEAGLVEMESLGQVGDGWAEVYESLEGFDMAKYGVKIPK